MNSKMDWIKNLVSRNPEADAKDLYGFYDEFLAATGYNNINEESFKRYVRKCLQELDEPLIYNDDVYENVQAKIQRTQDLNNQLRKENRETYRIYSELEETYNEFINQFSKLDFSGIKVSEVKAPVGGQVGILTLADAHINEIIRPSDTGGNEYDFEVFARRLKKYVTKATKVFKDNKVKELYVFMLGDMINSPRRLAERISMNASLVTATLLAVHVFTQMIMELSKNFKLHITYCVGNESRLQEDRDSNRILASDNWDHAIFQMLRMVFKDKPVDFILPENLVQSVVRIPMANGTYNALITHGDIFRKGLPTDRTVGNILQNYAHQGMKIDGIFIGHFHNAKITDFIQATGSLKGGDAWSYNDCGFASRASQNIYLINPDMSLDGMKIDVQVTSPDDPTYEIKDELTTFGELINPAKVYGLNVLTK